MRTYPYNGQVKTAKKIFSTVYRAWIAFGNLLGMIMSAILLSILYFTMVAIIAIIAILFRKDFLRTKHEKHTYWLPAEKEHLHKLDELQFPF